MKGHEEKKEHPAIKVDFSGVLYYIKKEPVGIVKSYMKE